MCGLSKRLQSVQRGENLYDESGTKFAVGVLASLHALVVYEIQKIESEALKLFPVRVSFTSDHQVIPVGAIAAQGSGTPLTVSECVLWICQIQKMITAESVT